MSGTTTRHSEPVIAVNEHVKPKSKRGFASMSEEKKHLIASSGGKAAQQKGKAYKFDPVTASLAGKKGGKTVSQDREHMSIIGQKGGQNRSKKRGLNRYDQLISAWEAANPQNNTGNLLGNTA